MRSIGKVDYVVTTILSDRSLFPDVFDGMSNSDPIIRMRAADAVEKITRNNPALLFPFKKKLLEEVSQIEQQEVRWHLAQMFSRLELDENELGRVVYLLNRWIEGSKSNIVKVKSMQTLCEISFRFPNLKQPVIQILQELTGNGSPAVVNRGKKLLRVLGVKDI